MTSGFLSLCTCSVSLVVAQLPSEKNDLKLLQGTWRMVAAHRQGKDVTKEMPKGYKITFRGKLWIVEMNGRKPFDKNTAHIRLDPSKTPKQFNCIWTLIIAQGAGERRTRLQLPGIYKIDGDTLRLCWDVGRATGRRPSSFVTKAGTEYLSLTLRRELKKQKKSVK